MRRSLYTNSSFISAFVLVVFINISLFSACLMHKCYSGYQVFLNLKEFDQEFAKEIEEVLRLKKELQEEKESKKIERVINNINYLFVVEDGKILDYWIVE